MNSTKMQKPAVHAPPSNPVSAAAQPSSHGKLREHKPSDSGGLVSNASLQEEELEQFFAPDSALAEEERLRKEREEQQAKADPPVQPTDAEVAAPVLEDRKFLQLEQLLNQSRAYTQFLSEQLADAAGEEEEEGAGGGRRRGVWVWSCVGALLRGGMRPCHLRRRSPCGRM